MNKQEIEHELVRARAAETTIKNNIIELLEQLVEAEKPKLGHGDFGIDENDNNKGLLVVKQQNREYPITSFDKNAYPCGMIVNEKHATRTMTKFGNIFDLMKDWGEDLEKYAKVGWGTGKLELRHTIKDFIKLKLIEFRIRNDSATFDLSEAEEIWRKLGRMIMTLKRKQS